MTFYVRSNNVSLNAVRTNSTVKMTIEQMHFKSSADAAKVREPNIQQVPWKFISIATRAQFYKTFYDLNLQMFVGS